MAAVVPIVVLAGQSNAIIGPVSYHMVQNLSDQGTAFEFVMLAMGATSLVAKPTALDWDPASPGELTDQLIASINAAAAHVEAQGQIPEVSILWMQGESDVAQSAAAYQDKLTQFIGAVRAGIGQPDAAFVIATLSTAGSVRTAQLAVADAVHNVDIVDTFGFPTLDGIHYFDEGSEQIAAGFAGIVNPVVPAVPGYANLLAPATTTPGTSTITVNGPLYYAFDFTAPDNRAYTVKSWYGPDHVVLGDGDDTILTFVAADIVEAGGGNDTINAGPGNDIVHGGAGSDNLYGYWGADTLSGDAGSDFFQYSGTFQSSPTDPDLILDFVAGEDSIDLLELGPLTFIGTANFTAVGQIRYVVGSDKTRILINTTGNLNPDLEIDLAGQHLLSAGDFSGTLGADQSTVLSNKSYRMIGQPYLNLILTGTADIDGTGNGTVNRLTGNSGNNVLDGSYGADTMIGGLGNDSYVVENTGDMVVEDANAGTDMVLSSVSYSLSAHVERLTLTGTANINGTGNDLANVITGNSGHNILNGLGGADMMTGGAGDDIYYLDAAGDRVVEVAGGGTDTVYSSIGYQITPHVERLVLTGTANINGAGNDLNNNITGNSGNNMLTGMAGADTMSGGLGDDGYNVDMVGDLVIEAANAGTDTVYSSIGYQLTPNVERLVLTGTTNINGAGNDLANILTGNSGNNMLTGMGGADTMSGGMGDDGYNVDMVGDLVIEAANAGTDTVYSSIGYQLTPNVERLVLTGTTNINGAGNELDNVITGNSGNNFLTGMAGADTMSGGMGDDSYNVDTIGDKVIEAANAGTDTVLSSISHGLTANVERLVLTGTANINGAGNELDNVITGNSGNNFLTGMGGADTMSGGMGDDSYNVDNLGDKVVEAANAGTDTVISAISYQLTAHVERLSLSGTASINGAGNDIDNSITGNGGSNVLTGMGGADSLNGGLGTDVLTGGTGADSFLFTTALGAANIDRITDFSVGEDRIVLDDAIFGMAGPVGTLAAAAFAIAAAASTADQRILYDGATGALFYDPDGSGAAAATQFAILTSGLAMSHDAFLII